MIRKFKKKSTIIKSINEKIKLKKLCIFLIKIIVWFFLSDLDSRYLIEHNFGYSSANKNLNYIRPHDILDHMKYYEAIYKIRKLINE